MNDNDHRNLMIGIKGSDHSAFETVFNQYHQAIFQFLLYKIKDPAIAEDLLQEVFFKLWKSRDRLDENQSIKNYLYTIADNLVLNHIRHLKVVSRHQQEANPKIFTRSDNPHFILEEKEGGTRLAKTIEALPEKTRVIFLMSRMEDLTYQEIADRLSISIKTVEGHMVKALKSLRESLSLKL
jgi:RNA polymerase sigma-70 factor (ECF subfamily)